MPRDLTLKQQRFLEALPKAKTLAEAGRIAGYSTSARAIYKPYTKRLIKKVLQARDVTKEGLTDKWLAVLELGRSKSDLTNVNRSLEDLARLNGLFGDKEAQTNVAIFQQFKSDLPQRVDIQTVNTNETS